MSGQIKARVQQQIKEAIKARQAERLAALRMVLSEIDSTRATDPSADELGCVRSYHRKLTKARAEYEKLNAAEQLARLDREMAVVSEFLPPALPDEQLAQIVEQVVRDNKFSQRDFGRAMKQIMAEHGDRAEGSRVAAMLKAKLAAGP